MASAIIFSLCIQSTPLVKNCTENCIYSKCKALKRNETIEKLRPPEYYVLLILGTNFSLIFRDFFSFALLLWVMQFVVFSRIASCITKIFKDFWIFSIFFRPPYFFELCNLSGFAYCQLHNPICIKISFKFFFYGNKWMI